MILDASLRLFSQKGFARTSVRDIAQAAGITDAAIYYHFASKRALFEALFEERGITSAIAELEQASVTEPPLEAFRAIALTGLDVMYRNRDFLRVLLTGALGRDRVAMEEYRGIVVFKALVNPLVSWIWVGGGVLTLGGLIAFWPFGGRGVPVSGGGREERGTAAPANKDAAASTAPGPPSAFTGYAASEQDRSDMVDSQSRGTSD